jgi:hypothetical protein
MGASMRLIPHPENFAPITATALFGAVYLPKKYAFIIPLSALLISDLFLGFYGLEMAFVYGSFIISGLIGLMIKSRKNIFTVIGATLTASILFYLITNFGVWLEPRSWYTKDLAGLLQSYTAGIPFFRNTLMGDFFYTGVLFGTYELTYFLAKRFLTKKLIQSYF